MGEVGRRQAGRGIPEHLGQGTGVGSVHEGLAEVTLVKRRLVNTRDRSPTFAPPALDFCGGGTAVSHTRYLAPLPSARDGLAGAHDTIQTI